MGLVRLYDITFGDIEVDAALVQWRQAIEQALTWEVSGSADFEAGPAGFALHVKRQLVAQIAKVGSSAIPAMSGSTPGSGGVSLYTFDGTTLEETDAATAFNLHPTEEVTANAWVKVIYIDGHPFIFWEPCS